MTNPLLRSTLKERGFSVKLNKPGLGNRLIHAINEGVRVINETELPAVQTQSQKRNNSLAYAARAIEEEKDTNVTNIMCEDYHTKTKEKRSYMASY